MITILCDTETEKNEIREFIYDNYCIENILPSTCERPDFTSCSDCGKCIERFIRIEKRGDNL